MNLDDALLWLNDRLGKDVTVNVMVERGDVPFSVFDAGGELRHWTDGTAALEAPSRDHIQGIYDVGEGASFDLSNVQPLEVTTEPDESLVIRLDEKTTLDVVEHKELPATQERPPVG